MAFHLGKPIAAMIALACVAGLLTRFTGHSSGRADVELWTFSDSHRRAFTGADNPPGEASPLERFERDTGLSATVRLIQYRAMNTRLSTLILGDVRGPEVPDVAEIEIGTVGRFFNAPVDQVGFLPLNDLLARHGWNGRFVANRLASWSKDGEIFGVPADIHPTTIAYNDALFRAAGVDLSTCETWDQFVDACVAAQAAWRAQGATNRWAFELPQNGPSILVTMLLQRDVNLIDAQGTLWMTDPRVLDTLIAYCRMAAGPRRIGGQPSEGNQVYGEDMAGGMLAAMIAPDWRLTYLRQYAPNLAGKVKVMPLPRWPDSPRRTSTMGGTGIAIPRNAADPERSWRLIEALCLGPEAIPGEKSYTLPAVRTLWAQDPRHDERDAYFSGQPVRRLLAGLAEDVPSRYASPSAAAAETALGQVLISAIGKYRADGEAGFREYCAKELAWAQQIVQARIEHATLTK